MAWVWGSPETEGEGARARLSGGDEEGEEWWGGLRTRLEAVRDAAGGCSQQ